MFYYIEGIVTEIGSNLTVIDCGGVGFACGTSANTLSYLEKGEKARLYTYCNIKEDAFDIYGFYDEREKHCFEMLISVSGVGPKAAISILSAAAPEDLAMAIITDNEKVLTAAQGIGKRLAQRIILELKDKMSRESGEMQKSGYRPASGTGAGSTVNDAAAALTVLGYTQQEITQALRSIDTTGLKTEEIVKLVLKASIK